MSTEILGPCFRPAKCHPEKKLFCKGLCKACYSRRSYYKHIDVIREKDRIRSKKRDPKKEKIRIRPYRIRYDFGISEEEYDSKLEAQSNMCALCNKEFYGVGREKGSPVLDHEHKNKKLREFIHRECNTAIGLLKEDPEVCRMAAEYLEKHIGDQNVRVKD